MIHLMAHGRPGFPTSRAGFMPLAVSCFDKLGRRAFFHLVLSLLIPGLSRDERRGRHAVEGRCSDYTD